MGSCDGKRDHASVATGEAGGSALPGLGAVRASWQRFLTVLGGGMTRHEKRHLLGR